MYGAKRGFLDGAAGFHYAVLLAIYEYFVGLKAAEMGGNETAAGQ
jgi:hypothetical protein